ISGRSIYLTWYRLRGAMGKAKVQVDDGPSKAIDGWFAGTWGGYRDTQSVAQNLSPGIHRVGVQLLEEANPQSSGHEFRVLAVGAADVTAPPTTAPLPQTCYLFTSFRGNGEDGLHLAWSTDGIKWQALNHDKGYLAPHVGRENLMRDP